MAMMIVPVVGATIVYVIYYVFIAFIWFGISEPVQGVMVNVGFGEQTIPPLLHMFYWDVPLFKNIDFGPLSPKDIAIGSTIMVTFLRPRLIWL